MGYLDGSSITVDAILTKKGREILAKGADDFFVTTFVSLVTGLLSSFFTSDLHPIKLNPVAINKTEIINTFFMILFFKIKLFWLVLYTLFLRFQRSFHLIASKH